jgi:hypothetical protein
VSAADFWRGLPMRSRRGSRWHHGYRATASLILDFELLTRSAVDPFAADQHAFLPERFFVIAGIGTGCAVQSREGLTALGARSPTAPGLPAVFAVVPVFFGDAGRGDAFFALFLMIFRVFLAALLIGAFFRFPLASGSIVVE